MYAVGGGTRRGGRVAEEMIGGGERKTNGISRIGVWAFGRLGVSACRRVPRERSRRFLCRPLSGTSTMGRVAAQLGYWLPAIGYRAAL